MTNPKVATGFSRLKDLELALKAKYILSSLTGNANFATPTPSLRDIDEAIKNFETALGKAVSGTKSDTAAKNAMRAVLEENLTNLGLYVQLNGKNEESILLSSGFDLQKSRTSVGVLAKPDNFKVEPGDGAGSVKLSLNSIEGADSYLFEYTEAPVTNTSNWLTKPSTKTYITITGLVSGKQYAFKVSGVGSNPSQVFSDIVFSYIL